MSAEGNLYNPAIFEPLSPNKGQTYFESLPNSIRDELGAVKDPFDAKHSEAGFPDVLWMARRYLAIVRGLKTKTSYSAIKSHLFKLCRSLFEDERFQYIRNNLGVVKNPDRQKRTDDYSAVLDSLEDALQVCYPCQEVVCLRRFG